MQNFMENYNNDNMNHVNNTNNVNATNQLKTSQAIKINYSFYFYLLMILHFVLWTIVPTFLRHSLPMDALEGFVWGQNWLLGYDRNPWLNAWLTHLGVVIGGSSGWLIYAFSQLSVVTCFFVVWKLGTKITNQCYALVAVFLLQTMQYYTLASVDLNDNVLELGIWALIILYFYEALLSQKIRYWLSVGLWAGLALMTKYYAIVLFFPMLLVMLLTQEGRNSFKKLGFYLGVVLFFAIITPHFIWLFSNGFVTIQYAVMRVSAENAWHNSGGYFALVHLLAILPMLIIYGVFFCKNLKNGTGINFSKSSVNYFDKIFLLLLAFGPFVITILLALIFKYTLHVMWGTPLLSLWSLVLITFIKPKISAKRLKAFVYIIFSIFFLVISVYSYNIIYTGYISSATYPGQKISNYIDVLLDKYKQKNKPYYVIGDRYTAGNVAYFSKNNLKTCIWEENIHFLCENDDVIKSKGAIFVWQSNDIYDKAEQEKFKKFWQKVKQRFPHVSKINSKNFTWIYHADKSPLQVSVAFFTKATP